MSPRLLGRGGWHRGKISIRDFPDEKVRDVAGFAAGRRDRIKKLHGHRVTCRWCAPWPGPRALDEILGWVELMACR